MNRRDFIKAGAFAAAGGYAGRSAGISAGAPNSAYAGMSAGAPNGAYAGISAGAPNNGTLRKWRPGEYQVHFIYTGVAESSFHIFPDGTSMLLDCGDHAAITRGAAALPVTPGPERLAGEWIARYVRRVNPRGSRVDYMFTTHWHGDHTGSHAWQSRGPGPHWENEWWRSGFGLAAEQLVFSKAIDRGWPSFDDPIPFHAYWDDPCEHMRRVYAWLAKRDGLTVEKFRLGATDQIVPLHDPAAARGFEVFNAIANGRIASRDGAVRDFYTGRKNVWKINENALSLGIVVRCGDFALFTAGDFNDVLKNPDGTSSQLEALAAPYLERVDVAKLNHHGRQCAPAPFVRALAPAVWTSCVWDEGHNTADTMERLSDRGSYPGERLLMSGCFSPKMLAAGKGRPWLRDVAPECARPTHVVVTVAPGGGSYDVTSLDAADERMRRRRSNLPAARGPRPRATYALCRPAPEVCFSSGRKRTTPHGKGDCRMKSIHIAFAGILAATAAGAATPEVTEVAVSQERTRTVTVEYSLSGAPAIVTVDVLTNAAGGAWASIGGANISRLSGDVNVKVASDGVHSFTWQPDQSWIDHAVKSENVKFVVTAWATDNPPDYMVLDLVENGKTKYYTGVSFLPGGLLDNREYRISKMVLRKCPAKDITYTIGVPVGTPGRDNKEYVREVTMAHDFYIAVFETTQGQWATLTGAKAGGQFSVQDWEMRPQTHTGHSNIREGNSAGTENATYRYPADPAENSFMGLLYKRTGIRCDLPSESQWEIACRAGGDYGWNGNGSVTNTTQDANFPDRYKFNGGFIDGVTEPPNDSDASVGTAICGSYPPNPWGLYDMYGNVAEITNDNYQYDTRGNTSGEPIVIAGSTQVMAKGSAWNYGCGRGPGDRGNIQGYTGNNKAIGFRVMTRDGLK